MTYRRAMTLIAVGVAILATSACSGGVSGSPGAVDLSSSKLQQFSHFPVYWVGEQYAGHGLDRIVGQYPGEDDDPILILYGSCGATFEAGCVEDLVIKSARGCLRAVDDGILIREHTSRRGAHLEIQAGDAVVTLYAASRELEAEAAREIVTANGGATSTIPTVAKGSALPGSLCELQRLHPRVNPAPPRPAPLKTEEAHPATVIASFGDFESVQTLDEAASKVGWRVLRTNDPRFTLYSPGALRTLGNSLAELEQTKYFVVGRRYPIEIYQEPESYRTFDVAPYSSTETIGHWAGDLWTYRAQLGFKFYSGEVVNGQRVRVSVFGERGSITLDDIRAFVRTLTFGD